MFPRKSLECKTILPRAATVGLVLMMLIGCGDDAVDASSPEFRRLTPEGIEDVLAVNGEVPVAPGLFAVDESVGRFSVNASGNLVPDEVSDLTNGQVDLFIRPLVFANPQNSEGQPAILLGSYNEDQQLELFNIDLNHVAYYGIDGNGYDHMQSICDGVLEGVRTAKLDGSIEDGLTIHTFHGEDNPVARILEVNFSDLSLVVDAMSSDYHEIDLDVNC